MNHLIHDNQQKKEEETTDSQKKTTFDNIICNKLIN